MTNRISRRIAGAAALAAPVGFFIGSARAQGTESTFARVTRTKVLRILKNTSLVSTIAVPDLLYQGQLITADTYRPLETYTMVAVIYFLLLFPMTLLAQSYERRLARR